MSQYLVSHSVVAAGQSSYDTEHSDTGDSGDTLWPNTGHWPGHNVFPQHSTKEYNTKKIGIRQFISIF